MCDFHSVIVTGDGKILHLASNSHSDIRRHFSLPVGLDAKWWECEWDGTGDMPINIAQQRGKDNKPTAMAERAAVRHYEKLAEIVAGNLDPAETAPFDGPEYGDVRAKYKDALARKAVEPIIALLEEMDYQEDAIREIISQLSLDVDEIAKERIEELEAEKESAFENGVEAGQEDMYSWDCVQEEIERAVEKAREEAHEEGFAEGFAAAKNGAAGCGVEYIDGMPSFLFE